MPDGELISVTINDGIKKFSELGRHDTSNDDKSKYKKVCVGDIAYNSMRMWQGASGCSPYEGIVSPAYTVLAPNSGINSKCMAYQFKLPATIHTFKINSQGITSDNWNLKFPALSEIEIYISPYEQEQAKIAAYFANLDHLITLHQRKFYIVVVFCLCLYPIGARLLNDTGFYSLLLQIVTEGAARHEHKQRVFRLYGFALVQDGVTDAVLVAGITVDFFKPRCEGGMDVDAAVIKYF